MTLIPGWKLVLLHLGAIKKALGNTEGFFASQYEIGYSSFVGPMQISHSLKKFTTCCLVNLLAFSL